MNKTVYQMNSNPLRSSQSAPVIPAPGQQTARRKFAFGYYFEKRAGLTFRQLAEQYAPFLQEVYFPWPGRSNARAPAS